MENVSASVQQLARWVDGHGFRSVGPSREVYLEVPGDLSEFVTELQEPIAAARGERLDMLSSRGAMREEGQPRALGFARRVDPRIVQARADGRLPISVQIVGPRWSEISLLDIASGLESLG